MKRAILSSLTLVACEPSPAAEAGPSTASSLAEAAPRDSARGQVASSASPERSASPAPSASAPGAAPIAPLSYVRRERPSAEAWSSAPDLPSVPPYGAKACLGKRLGDWVLVRSSVSQMPRLLDDFPTKEGRYFAGAGQIELRLLPGEEVRVECAGEQGWSRIRTKVYVAWPEDEAEPLRAEVRELSGTQLSVLELDQVEPVPASPAGAHPPPKPGDWAKATPVNTAATSSRYGGCDLRFLRGWARLRCPSGGSYIHREGDAFSQFGKAEEDYFVRKELWLGQIVFRLEPGRSIRFDATTFPEGFSLRAEWPAGADRPSVLALENRF